MNKIEAIIRPEWPNFIIKDAVTVAGIVGLNIP